MNKIYSFLLAAGTLTLIVSSFAAISHASNANSQEFINIDKVNNYGVVQNSTTTFSNTGINGSVVSGGNTNSNTNASSGNSNSNSGNSNANNASGNANADSTTFGGNTSSFIQTGDAGASSTVTNCVNTTNINSNGSSCIAATSTPVPTATPTPGSGGGSTGGGDNGGSGSSGGSSGSTSSSGSGSGSTQAVLGTMASTGTFADTMMNVVGLMGLGLLLLSSAISLKDKSLAFEVEVLA